MIFIGRFDLCCHSGFLSWDWTVCTRFSENTKRCTHGTILRQESLYRGEYASSDRIVSRSSRLCTSLTQSCQRSRDRSFSDRIVSETCTVSRTETRSCQRTRTPLYRSRPPVSCTEEKGGSLLYRRLAFSGRGGRGDRRSTSERAQPERSEGPRARGGWMIIL